MRIVVTFESDKFNLTEHKDYFINEGCFGDDLGKWLIDKLSKKGIKTDSEPGQEDFGWYVDYVLNGQQFCAVIGNVGGEFWFIIVERSAGFISSMLGGRHRNVPESGINLLHQILSSSTEVKNLKWHHWKVFTKGGRNAFESGSLLPSAP